VIQHLFTRLKNLEVLDVIKILKIFNKYQQLEFKESPLFKKFKESVKELCIERIDELNPQIIVQISKAFSQVGLRQPELTSALNRRMLACRLSNNSFKSFTTLIGRYLIN
jgi:hypothetical protein